MKFANKVAVITAAAGAGIGQATARALASAGASVVVSDQHERRVIQVARDIAEKYGVRTLPFVCDVRNDTAISALVFAAVKEFGAIDYLVNNAGFDVFQTLNEVDVDAIRRVLDVNLASAILVTKAVLAHMISRGSGSIVNLSSIAAHSPDSGDSAVYAAAKAGIEAFTRSVAREVGCYGVRVNCVAPSVTLNPFLASQMPKRFIDDITSKMPLGPLSPDDQARAIVFLLSDEASMISGATLNVTGGY